MPNPCLTGSGWLIRMPDGSLQEFATDAEALEAWQNQAESEGLT